MTQNISLSCSSFRFSFVLRELSVERTAAVLISATKSRSLCKCFFVSASRRFPVSRYVKKKRCLYLSAVRHFDFFRASREASAERLSAPRLFSSQSPLCRWFFVSAPSGFPVSRCVEKASSFRIPYLRWRLPVVLLKTLFPVKGHIKSPADKNTPGFFSGYLILPLLRAAESHLKDYNQALFPDIHTAIPSS